MNMNLQKKSVTNISLTAKKIIKVQDEFSIFTKFNQKSIFPSFLFLRSSTSRFGKEEIENSSMARDSLRRSLGGGPNHKPDEDY